MPASAGLQKANTYTMDTANSNWVRMFSLQCLMPFAIVCT